MIELKTTVKTYIAHDEHGTASIYVAFDEEFGFWEATATLKATANVEEQAILALEPTAEMLLRSIRGSGFIGQKTKRLKTREARTLEDAELMRQIRNSCSHFMTNNPKEIDPTSQQEWFDALDRNLTVPLISFKDDKAVGFGLSSLIDDRKYITAGLLAEHRGAGLGEELFRDVIRWTGIPCWLEVLKTNAVAKCLYDKLGFKLYAQEDDRFIMVLRNLPE